MNVTKAIIAFVFVDFLALTLYTTFGAGWSELMAFFETANTWTVTVVADLCIALALCSAWMWVDAKKQGISSLPYILLTLATGSIGPLLYLLRRNRPATAA